MYGIFAAACFILFFISSSTLLVSVFGTPSISIADILLPFGFVTGGVLFAGAARTAWIMYRTTDD